MSGELLEDVDSAELWHTDIEKCDVRLPRLDQLKGLAAVDRCRNDNDRFLVIEVAGNRIDYCWVIVRQQESHHWVVTPSCLFRRQSWPNRSKQRRCRVTARRTRTNCHIAIAERP